MKVKVSKWIFLWRSVGDIFWLVSVFWERYEWGYRYGLFGGGGIGGFVLWGFYLGFLVFENRVFFFKVSIFFVD